MTKTGQGKGVRPVTTMTNRKTHIKDDMQPQRQTQKQQILSVIIILIIIIHSSIIFFSRQASKDVSKGEDPTSPCNMYIGFDFSVWLGQLFKFRTAVKDVNVTQSVLTQFNPFKKVQDMTLSEAAQKIRDVPNAGGTSVISEMLSFEMMKKCYGATLLKTEMEVEYFPHGGSITDYICEIYGTKIGVSVTRAMKFKGNFMKEDAETLLSKKLKGVLQATNNTLERWTKQVLHIWAINHEVANTLNQTLDSIDRGVVSNTVVLITVAKNSPEIFYNK